MLDGEWPAVRGAFEAWLAPENFDADGRQRVALAQLRQSPRELKLGVVDAEAVARGGAPGARRVVAPARRGR